MVASVALCATGLAAPQGAAADQTITISPNAPTSTGCIPFGGSTGLSGFWVPNAAFVYKNVPKFELKNGDLLAFDMTGTNDTDIHVDIALAGTTVDGGDVQSGSFTTVAHTTQTPSNPRGNTTVGDFELRFVADTPFSFPGGGLIIRLSNPSGPYANDSACTAGVYGPALAGPSNDPSGNFVESSVVDADGVAPWQFPGTTAIAAFRLQIIEPTAPKPQQPNAKDTRAPVLKLGGSRSQRVLRQRGVIVTVKADEASTAVAGATIALPKGSAKVVRLKQASKTLAPGSSTKLKLKLSKKRLGQVRGALREGKKLRAKINVTVRDAAGNAATGRRTVALK